MDSVKKLFMYISYFILLILITLSVYIFVVTDVFKKDYVNIFGYTYFNVATDSMTGTIDIDDVIIVKLGDNVKTDDIICYVNYEGVIITHMVINIDGDIITTKGDSVDEIDRSFNRKSIIGKVVKVFKPSIIFEFIALCIVIIIALILIGFTKSKKKEEDLLYKDILPEDVFSAPEDRTGDAHSGLTITIPLKEIMSIKKIQDDAFEQIGTSDKVSYDKEKELVDMIDKLLRLKNNSTNTTRINKKWLVKYQYVYKLTNIVYVGDTRSLYSEVEHPSFKEVYDYDIEKIGLYENLRNNIYEMPIYVFLKILFLAILYNDDKFFDGVFKIMKYKIMIDKDNHFREISKSNIHGRRQIKNLITLMNKVSLEYDNKNVFELDKIERLVKIKNYINE